LKGFARIDDALDLSVAKTRFLQCSSSRFNSSPNRFEASSNSFARDRLVGTLYIGEPYEQTPWGLGPDEQAHYTTFIQNVVGPFRELYALLGRMHS